MKYCPYCGAEIQNDAQSCPNCGKNVTTSPFDEQLNPTQNNNVGKINTMCIVGFVLSFLMPLLGLIFSIIGLIRSKRNGERGFGLAIAGIAISIAMFIANYLINMYVLMPMLEQLMQQLGM